MTANTSLPIHRNQTTTQPQSIQPPVRNNKTHYQNPHNLNHVMTTHNDITNNFISSTTFSSHYQQPLNNLPKSRDHNTEEMTLAICSAAFSNSKPPIPRSTDVKKSPPPPPLPMSSTITNSHLTNKRTIFSTTQTNVVKNPFQPLDKTMTPLPQTTVPNSERQLSYLKLTCLLNGYDDPTPCQHQQQQQQLQSQSPINGMTSSRTIRLNSTNNGSSRLLIKIIVVD